ncbi:MAG: DUF4185 domain-containing protein [Verrucomicrobia bacterium]|nr:DUF4185 domain-containing protein [Verrucomicrobiota bacterium]MCF7707398.1 DUF4185 domain-containing protein [Verrucomicrobiota bacterium]
MKIFLVVSVLCILISSVGGRVAAEPPYPRSSLFAGINFHESTLRRRAPGSDIWSCTWAGNGQVFAAWGDGGGFGGTDVKGRVSIGVAAVSGEPQDCKGVNVWGGIDPVSRQKPTIGKGTILAVDSKLYLFISEQDEWDRCRLWKSRDNGRNWEDKGWIFPESHKIFAFPGLIQFGCANRLSPDGYVYGFSDNDPRRVEDKRLYLFRVKKGQIEELDAYEYFSGTPEKPEWSGRIQDRKSVFFNPEGIGWGTTCVFHPASDRYLLTVTTHENRGDWGLYESRRPWGPWKTVAYGEDLPQWTYSPAEKDRPAYLHTFPAKWISDDGTTLWCVFDRGDRFNLVKCTLQIK